MKKMLPWLSTIMLGITLIVLAAVLLVDRSNADKSSDQDLAETTATKHLSADEIVELTSEITDIKTNLAGYTNIVQLNLAFQVNSKEAKEDFEKIKEIQIKPAILQKLADTKPEQLESGKNRDLFLSELTDLINKELPSGRVMESKITSIVVAGL
ncbi:flagellar basal body-associated FliL family protein [Paenibacillus provencensis]|uniref:Flagellar protein FliL n=1 Tax=Paenibacillus provencensis TaxID=441151 RepID=A0ABW3PUB9_9BACL|nr:flagellar basal body-associated FliL family protein [Paenibacillus sp. MER 78]MCM3128721.1 flagellar basal body-associated FliL family protein [Paenibacillus sp. MER 78]